MTLMLDAGSIDGVLGMNDAIDLLEAAFRNEAAGATFASPKFVTEFQGGAMRVLFAADGKAGYCAMKAYHNIKGVGARYVVLLYSATDGRLLAVVDGRLITDLRTGAASGVAARRVSIAGPVSVGVVGSGNQARTQLESLAAVHALESAVVYSPNAANRTAYASEMSARLQIPVTAVDSAEAAVRGHAVVAVASNARGAEPVVRGEWLDDCRLLCAVGNTRRQFAEIDVACVQRAGLVIVDSPHAFDEAGEMVNAVAAGVLPEAKRATLAEIVTGPDRVPGSGLVVFKSVGMALQDLALSARYYELLQGRANIARGPDVASLRDQRRRAYAG